MLFHDINGNNISFSDDELYLICFYMTGMSLNKLSVQLDMTEKKISAKIRLLMKAVGASNKIQFIRWFLDYKKENNSAASALTASKNTLVNQSRSDSYQAGTIQYAAFPGR